MAQYTPTRHRVTSRYPNEKPRLGGDAVLKEENSSSNFPEALERLEAGLE